MRDESLVPPDAPAPLLSGTIFADPEVRSAIVSALRWRHVPPNDIEDLTQEVLLRALSLDQPPPTLPECLGLVRKMATDLAVDRMRSLRIRGRFHAGLHENPDAHPASDTPMSDVPEAIDQRRQLDFADRAIDRRYITERQAAIMAAEASDVPQSEIARDLRVSFQTVRNELARGRRKMRESWAAYAALSLAALLGVLAGLLRDRNRPTLAKTDVPEPNLDHPVEAPELTPEETADALRRMARHACDVGEWFECAETLGRAAELDPAGDAKPWVQKMKSEALQHLDEK
jgi:DNA-directed RNA polymerase specialized sigma24 family protein